MSVTVKPVYLASDFRISVDEALLTYPRSIFESEVYSPTEINFGFALATEFGVVFSHRVAYGIRCPFSRNRDSRQAPVCLSRVPLRGRQTLRLHKMECARKE